MPTIIVPGSRVKEERELRDWTQEVLGKKAGLSRFTIVRIESSARVRSKYFDGLDRAFGGTSWRGGHSLVMECGNSSLEQRVAHLEEKCSRISDDVAEIKALLVDVPKKKIARRLV